MSFGKILSNVFKTKGGPPSSALRVSNSGSGAAPDAARQALNQLSKLVNHVIDGPEKEWTCWCGHKFRAAGEWYPTEACYCEAPACPNPTFFLDGKGRLMLEAQAQGKDPKSVEGGGASASTPTPTPTALPKGSMGSRFK